MDMKSKGEVDREVKKMKEVLGQEIEFKIKHYEEAFLKKKRDIEEELIVYKEEFI